MGRRTVICVPFFFVFWAELRLVEFFVGDFFEFDHFDGVGWFGELDGGLGDKKFIVVGVLT